MIIQKKTGTGLFIIYKVEGLVDKDAKEKEIHFSIFPTHKPLHIINDLKFYRLSSQTFYNIIYYNFIQKTKKKDSSQQNLVASNCEWFSYCL